MTATAIKKPAMTLEQIMALEHTFIGPVWTKCPDGSWYLPEMTLGWEIAAWCTKWLDGMEDGQPWKFTPEQLRFILWWYAVDEYGEFIYRTGVLQRMKGWGKDPLLAVVCLIEFVGPSRVKLDRGQMVMHPVDSPLEGQPVGVAHRNPWVQVTAVSQTQTSNTMSMIPLLASQRMIDHFGIKPGSELMRANNGRAHLQAVTSNYRALEGKRTTFSVKNETHHWVESYKGHDMANVIEGNSSKMNSRWLSITNAFMPGEDSVAEREREAWEKIRDGRVADNKMFYDSVEAHPATPLTPEALRVVLPVVMGDAIQWLSVEAMVLSVLSSQVSPAWSRRMYLNQIVADEDALYGPEHWKAIEDPDAVLEPGDEIVMGFDGGRTDDSTALVAIRISDQCSFILALEEKPDNWPDHEGAPKWHVNTDVIDSAVHNAFRLYTVRGFYADVALWESYIDSWAEAYREVLTVKATGSHAIAWDMRGAIQKTTRAHERLMTAVFDEVLRYNGDPDLRRHAMNARRRENNFGVSFGKESRESSRKVDAYAALMLAHEALHDFRTNGKVEKQRTGRGWFL